MKAKSLALLTSLASATLAIAQEAPPLEPPRPPEPPRGAEQAPAPGTSAHAPKEHDHDGHAADPHAGRAGTHDPHARPGADTDRRRTLRSGPRQPNQLLERGQVGERPPMQPGAFLGIVTEPVPQSLTAQLKLAHGFGLVVSDVMPGSPAAEGGVQKFDVLTHFDDQQLVSPEQLAALTRSRKEGDNVTLTLRRHTEEQKVTVKLGERLMPVTRPLNRPDEFHRHAGQMQRSLDERTRQLQRRTREFQERMDRFQERLRDWQRNPGSGPAPEPPKLDLDGIVNAPPPPRDILNEVRPGGAPAVSVKRDGEKSTWSTAQARISVKDADGELEITSQGGRRVLTVKNQQGETTFSGGIDTKEQRRALPEPIRRKLEQVQVHTATSHAESSASPGSRR